MHTHTHSLFFCVFSSTDAARFGGGGDGLLALKAVPNKRWPDPRSVNNLARTHTHIHTNDSNPISTRVN